MDTFSTNLLKNYVGDLNGHQAVRESDYLGLSPRDVALSRAVSSLVKKHEPENPLQQKNADEAALRLFMECNRRCASYSAVPNLRRVFSRRIWWDFDFTWPEIMKYSSLVGPGSSVGSEGRNDFVRKVFLNSHTATSDSVYQICRAHLLGDDYRIIGQPSALRMRPFTLPESRVVAGSSFFTVPKDMLISRCAATEPFCNMALQLGLGGFINRILAKRWGYDPALQQERNRRMACIGSLTGEIATIDLTTASDLISLGLCESKLPVQLVAAILDCRSPSVCIKGKQHTLEMVSTMGCGFTFPLETLIFTLICEEVARQRGVRLTRFDAPQPNFGVFGDDIVVPTGIFDAVIDELERFGMVPNRQKSFGGRIPFRESCGGDYYLGQNVRGVYIKKSKSEADCYSAINRVIRHATKWDYSPSTLIASLLKQVPKPKGVPRVLSDTAGVHLPLPGKLDNRYYLAPKSKELLLSNKKGQSRLDDYAHAWSSLGGYVRDCRVLLRQDHETVYVQKTLPTRLWEQRCSYHYEYCYKRRSYVLESRDNSWFGHTLPELGWSNKVGNLI